MKSGTNKQLQRNHWLSLMLGALLSLLLINATEQLSASDSTHSKHTQKCIAQIEQFQANKRTGALDKALEMLKDLQKCGAVYTLNNLDYSFGVLLKNAGKTTEAIECFNKLKDKPGALQPYVLYHLVDLYEKQNDFVLAAQTCLNLATYKDTPFETFKLKQRAADCNMRAKRFTEALKMYNELYKSARTKATRQELQLSIGRLHEKTGSHTLAFESYRSVVEIDESGYRSYQALQGMTRLAPKLKKAGITLSLRSLKALAQASYAAGEFKDSEDWFNAALKKGLPAKDKPEALFIMGRAAQRRNLIERSTNYFRQIIELPNGAGAWTKRARLQIARNYRLSKEYPKAHEQYELLKTAYKDSSILSEVYYSQGLTYQAAGDVPKALDSYWAVSSLNTADAFTEDALWRICLISLQKDDQEQALKALMAIAPNETGSTVHKFALFWLGKTAAQKHLYDEAFTWFQRLLKRYPNSYLAVRSRAILQEMKDRGQLLIDREKFNFEVAFADQVGDTEEIAFLHQLLAEYPVTPFRAELLLRFQEKLKENPHWSGLTEQPYKARTILVEASEAATSDAPEALSILPELLFHDDVAMATEVLRWYRSQNDNYKEFRPLLTLLQMAREQKNPNLEMITALQLTSVLEFPLDFEALPETIRTALFPATYERLIDQKSCSYGIEPFLLLSVARTESSMDTHIISSVGARGLMQFMPGTARTLASRLKLPDFTEAKLFDPEISLLMGMEYLKELLDNTDQELAQAIAAYNGGLDNVIRWRSDRLDASEEGYIAGIGFSETRDYVQKVLFSNYQYNRLYCDE